MRITLVARKPAVTRLGPIPAPDSGDKGSGVSFAAVSGSGRTSSSHCDTPSRRKGEVPVRKTDLESKSVVVRSPTYKANPITDVTDAKMLKPLEFSTTAASKSAEN